MRDSSIGMPRRQPGDCGNPPNIAIFFDGASALLPVVEHGVLKFLGGLSFDYGRGIGYNNTDSETYYGINYKNILEGGAGVKIRCCTTPLKKKLRFKCCEPNCDNYGDRMSIEVQRTSTCESPVLDSDIWVEPVDVYTTCGCTDSCCKKLTKLAKIINKNENFPAVASVVNIGTEWFLELESKEAGIDFRLIAFEGLTPPDVIVPNFGKTFTSADTIDWFPKEVVSKCDPEKCLALIEIWYIDEIPVDEGAGVVTSNYLTDVHYMKDVITHIALVFDPDNAQSVAQREELLTLLEGDGKFNSKISTTECADFPVYKYCIVRTDTGDDAALEAVREDYPIEGTDLISLDRSIYQSGKSYYTLTTKLAEAPDPIDPDVVQPGSCGPDDLPCTEPDGCPETDAAGCVNC